MATIQEVLARRGDLSTFLVHLTRSRQEITALDALKAILNDFEIKAQTPMGHACSTLESHYLSRKVRAKRDGTPEKKEALKEAEHWLASQRCVCFTETPLEHVALLAQEIEGRNCSFEPYGVAITKAQARRAGANPVWYVDITPGKDWLSKDINALVSEAIKGGNFASHPMARLAPFIEQMGSGPSGSGPGGYRKEFWWEREWRYCGDFSLPSRLLVLCPEAEWRELGKLDAGVKLLDPTWGLDRMIASLAGFRAKDCGPFVEP